MALNSSGAVQGATAGAALGANFGGWGAFGGAALGGLAGAFSRQGRQYGPNQEAIDMALARRQGEIASFANALAQARTRYMSNLQNLSDLTYSRFVPQAETAFAGRGLTVGGGAFQAALAKRAAELQAQGFVTASEAERADLAQAEALRGQAFGGWLSASSGANQPYSDPTGDMFGQLAGAGLGLYMGNRAEAMAGRYKPSSAPMPYGQGQLGSAMSQYRQTGTPFYTGSMRRRESFGLGGTSY